MKKIFASLAAILLMASAVQAQPGRVARPYPGGHRPMHSRGYAGWSRGYEDAPYFGFRAGMTLSGIHSNATDLRSTTARSGMYFGVQGGVPVMPYAPLFLESGLSFVEKGAKYGSGGSGLSYDLNYLEIPLLLRYKGYLGPDSCIEPFGGFYVAGGVGGQIRDYERRVAYSSFDNEFRRFDSGFRLGCSVSFLLFQLEAGYDIGLANISQDAFDNTRNRCFYLGLGLSF